MSRENVIPAGFGKEFYEEIVSQLHDGLYIVDRDRVIRFWNRAAELITGFSAGEVVGRTCSSNILTHVDTEGNNLCTGNCPLSDVISGGQNREDEVFLHHKAGHRVPVSVRVSPLKNEKGEVVGAVELFTDLREKEAVRIRLAELEKLAMIDNLTQIPNRRFMEKEILGRIAEKDRLAVPFGVLFMDIDHFKKFNDTYGHDTGDEVLKFVARTLADNSRPFDVCGRWGGEEFVGVIRNADPDELVRVAERFRMLIENSYLANNGEKLCVTISIGATSHIDGESSESLLKRADSLLYKSKESGRNRVTQG
ncbi:MAG TPA: GGDEF domain-containing protein [Synergistales bacterium]|nr:GGDEF domain-containing protein [Synergistales bacterium]HRV71474.1 GGDEF domain-containing protein [Thermovirgaceae bacterium]